MDKVKINGIVAFVLWIAAIIGVWIEYNMPLGRPLTLVTFLIVAATLQLIHFVIVYVTHL